MTYSMQDNTNFANQHYSISSNRSPGGHEKIRVNYSLQQIHHKGFRQGLVLFWFVFSSIRKRTLYSLDLGSLVKQMDVEKKVGQSKIKRMNVRLSFVHGEGRYFYINMYRDIHTSQSIL